MFTSFSSHWKGPWFKRGLWTVLALVTAALVFTGCPQPTDSDSVSVPENLKGEWVSDSESKEVYRITAEEFISLWDGAEGYKGNIVNIISDGENAGYIIIKYTKAYNPDAVGNYYAIHYKDLKTATVNICGAGKNDDPDGAYGGNGKATRAEAESTYTVDNGYFGGYSACTKKTTN
ncbi:MAG: hypothetical protein LBG10_05380 [Treponema sp.]|jgi:hypothetical protein|nr:hypothetical protein [Treponema sp.]